MNLELNKLLISELTEVRITTLESQDNPFDTVAVESLQEDINVCIVNCLVPPVSPEDFLQLGNQPEIKYLQGQQRIISIRAPKNEITLVKNLFGQTGYGQIFSLSPILRSEEDTTTSITALINSDTNLKALQKKIQSEYLPWEISASPLSSPILHINGSVAALNNNQSSSNISKETLPAVLPWPTHTSEIIRTIPNLPRLGPSSYLLINLNFQEAENPQNFEDFLNEIKVFSKSRDFFFSFNQNNQLIITALQERAVGRIAILAKELQKKYPRELSFFIGKGDISFFNNEDFSIDGLLNQEQNQQFAELSKVKPGIYSNNQALSKIKNSRDETAVELINICQTEHFNQIEIISNTDLVAETGPDRLISLTAEKDLARDVISPFHPHKILLVEAGAGMGKSRFIYEITKYSQHILKISFDPAGRNIQGFSLVNLATQLCQFIESNEELINEEFSGSIKKLMELNQKSESNKIQEANLYSDILKFYIQQTIIFLEEKLGNLTIVLDDLHHIDSFSDDYIMKLIEGTIEESRPTLQFIAARRPEARYESINQNNLFKRVGNTKINLQTPDGKPKLNLQNPHTIREYIQASLPDNLRYNPEDNTPRNIGNWADELSKIVTTGFELNSIIEEIKNNPDQYLIIQKDNIQLSLAGHSKIQKIHGQDMVIYHLEKMHYQLSANAFLTFQVMSMIGEKVCLEESLIELISQIIPTADGMPIPEDEVKAILNELTRQGYLNKKMRKTKTGLHIYYSIWHENLRDITLNYTLDKIQLADLSIRVFNALHDSPLLNDQVSDEQRFILLNNAAPLVDQPREFWDSYGFYASFMLKYAQEKHLHGLGFSAAEKIHNSLAHHLSTGLFRQNPKIQNLYIKSLFSIIEHGYLNGQFNQVYEAIAEVEELQKNIEIPDEKLKQMYLHGFEAAYTQINSVQLEAMYQRVSEYMLEISQSIAIELKLDYRKGNHQSCIEKISSFKRYGINNSRIGKTGTCFSTRIN